MTDYPSFVAGLKYEGRDHFNRSHYCATHLEIGDKLICKLEPDNPVDPDAVTFAPIDRPGLVIGYVPRKHHWIAEVLEEGKHGIGAVVTDIRCDGLVWWNALGASGSWCMSFYGRQA